MDTSLFVLGLLAGWCATPWPLRYPWWRWASHRQPEPACPLCGNLICALGGLGAAAVLAALWPEQFNLTNTLLMGLLGGRIAGALYAGFAPQRGED